VRKGSCPCGAVRFAVTGPVRDVLVCHCAACRDATGGPWAASAARRADLSLTGSDALDWGRAATSGHGASRGRCRVCGATVFWDAPSRDTVSFAVALLAEASDLEVAAYIWIGDEADAQACPPSYSEGLPPSIVVPWRD
jgi:hypothetical protein